VGVAAVEVLELDETLLVGLETAVLVEVVVPPPEPVMPNHAISWAPLMRMSWVMPAP
jgi:hypothetical protein